MAGKAMLLKSSLVIFILLYTFSIRVHAEAVEKFNPDEAVSDFESNKDLQRQLKQLNRNAKNIKPSNFTFDSQTIGESELGQTAIDHLLKKANKDSGKVETTSRGNVSKEQNITGIADENMARLRYEVLTDMGINPEITGFIFVSESMPESLIRAYSRDATRLGMSLVFFGFVDKGTTSNKFLSLSEKYHTKRNAMSIQADTRLFDAFEIEHVPSIVVTDIASLDICNETGPISKFKYQSKEYSFQKCNPAPADRYCKLSGSVFTDWAIKTMAENNCELAQNFSKRTHDYPATEQNTINAAMWEKYVSSYKEENQEWTEYEREVYKMMQGDFK